MHGGGADTTEQESGTGGIPVVLEGQCSNGFSKILAGTLDYSLNQLFEACHEIAVQTGPMPYGDGAFCGAPQRGVRTREGILYLSVVHICPFCAPPPIFTCYLWLAALWNCCWLWFPSSPSPPPPRSLFRTASPISLGPSGSTRRGCRSTPAAAIASAWRCCTPAACCGLSAAGTSVCCRTPRRGSIPNSTLATLASGWAFPLLGWTIAVLRVAGGCSGSISGVLFGAVFLSGFLFSQFYFLYLLCLAFCVLAAAPPISLLENSSGQRISARRFKTRRRTEEFTTRLNINLENTTKMRRTPAPTVLLTVNQQTTHKTLNST